MTGYSRDAFGAAWTDDNGALWGGNGCDTRDDILRRDLVAARVADGCEVRSGVLGPDPYTGRRLPFVRGPLSSRIQIDHVVALGDAWQTGAQQLPMAARVDLANDPLELLAVDGPTNEAKGDADTASWLPPNKAFRCTYVARQVAVKHKYRLWATPAERQAMIAVLSRCPSMPLPGGAVERQRTLAAPGGAPAAVPAQSAPRSRSGTSAGSVYYPNCAAARAAGAAPLSRGQPGYRPGLDGDHDGHACE